jgi:hypothetical protein
VTRRWAWGAILALSALAHAPGIVSPPSDYHYHRQANTAAIARNYHRNGLQFLKPQIDWEGPSDQRAATEFPLYMWLVGLFWPVGGLGWIWGRLIAAAFSAATAIYLYEFLRGELEPKEAFYGALAFTVLPIEIYFGRTIQPEALALFASMGSIYHWSRALERGRSWSHWAAAVVFAFLAIAHKIPYAYLLLVLAALALVRLGKKALSDWRVWLAPVVCLAGVVAWYLYCRSGVYVVPTDPDQYAKIFNYARLPFYVWFQFTSRYPELTTTYAGLLFVVLGARELIFGRKNFFYAWWLAAIAVYIVAGGAYTFYHEYTSLPFALVNAALIGVGVAAMAKKKPALAALLALSIPAHAAGRIKHWYKTDYGFLEKAGAAAEKISAPADLFVCDERAASLYLFFLDRKGWSWDWAESGAHSEDWLRAKIAGGAKFYMTRSEGKVAESFRKKYPAAYDADGMLIVRLNAPKASRP